MLSRKGKRQYLFFVWILFSGGVLFFLNISHAQAQTLTQSTYRWYDNNDTLTPVTPMAATNTAVTASGLNFRLRTNVLAGGGTLAATTSNFFLIQFATATSGPWTNVDRFDGSAVWRMPNLTPANGATITALLLGDSNVAETYVDADQNATGVFDVPNAVGDGQRGEYDIALQNNGAATGTTYYFRLIRVTGTALDGYTNYPSLTVATLTQSTYRWYDNNDALTPATPMVATNTAVTAAGLHFRLRLNLLSGGRTQSDVVNNFLIQFATATSGPWTDVGPFDGSAVWRIPDLTPSGGSTLTSLLLGDSNVAETFVDRRQTDTSVFDVPNAIGDGQRGEYDIALQNNGAATGTTYYFRLIRVTGTALDGYTNYPSLTVATLTQSTYRWYQNNDTLTPVTPLAATNTATSSGATNDIFRLRLNLLSGGRAQSDATNNFLIQFATSTTGPWTNVGRFNDGTAVWRTPDLTPSGGSTLLSILLGDSNVTETFVDRDQTDTSVFDVPNAVGDGQRGEYDIALQNNGAATSTTYFFRVILSPAPGIGLPFAEYANYPAFNVVAAAAVAAAAGGSGQVNTSPMVQNFTVSQSTSTGLVTFSYELKDAEQQTVWVNLLLLIPGEPTYDLSFPEFKTSGISVTQATSASSIFTKKSGWWDPSTSSGQVPPRFRDRYIPQVFFRLSIHDGNGGRTEVDSSPLALNPPPGFQPPEPSPVPAKSPAPPPSSLPPETGQTIDALFETLNDLQLKVAQLLSRPGALCFPQNLTRGFRGPGVTRLQQALSQEGLFKEIPTGFFGSITRQAVIEFQNRYQSDILSWHNLAQGTGFVGPSTRAKLNFLYCLPR